MTSVGTILTLVALFLLIGALLHRWGRRVDERAEAARCEADRLEAIELQMLQGKWEAAADQAGAIQRAAGGRRGPVARAHWVHARLLRAECDSGLARFDDARAGLEEAGGWISRIEDDEAAGRLGLRHRHLELLLALTLDDSPDARADAAREIDAVDSSAPGILDPYLAMRYASLANGLGHGEFRAGSWPRSLALFERSIRLSERATAAGEEAANPRASEIRRAFGARAVSIASRTCSELGVMLASMGRAGEAVEWLDRAIDLAEKSDLPVGRLALAHALLVRASHEPPERDPAGAKRARWIAGAREAALEPDWPMGRAMAGRAEIQLALLLDEGSPSEVERLLRSAAERVDPLDLPGTAVLRTQARLLLGQALEHQGRLDEAEPEYRRAFEAGSRDEDADSRRMAAVAGCHRHRLLASSGRTAEARACLEGLEALAPTLELSELGTVSVMVGRARGGQHLVEGDLDAASRAFEDALRLVESADGSDAARLVRQLRVDLGKIALSRKTTEQAAHWFRRALEVPADSPNLTADLAERAEIELGLGRALAGLDREREAVEAWRRAFEAGRESGRAGGRASAAIAALALGDREIEDEAVRRQWYERAANLGRWSGTPAGRQVVAAVAERRSEWSA